MKVAATYLGGAYKFTDEEIAPSLVYSATSLYIVPLPNRAKYEKDQTDLLYNDTTQRAAIKTK